MRLCDTALPWANEEMERAQAQDPDIGPVQKWFKESTIPSHQDLTSSPATRYYWLHAAQLRLKQGVLFIEYPPETRAKLLLPRSLHTQCFRLLHDCRLSGHPGIRRTTTNITNKVHWHNMWTDIKLYVKTCHTCQITKKANRNPKHPLTELTAGFPFERVHIDFCGPFPTTSRGNRVDFGDDGCLY